VSSAGSLIFTSAGRLISRRSEIGRLADCTRGFLACALYRSTR